MTDMNSCPIETRSIHMNGQHLFVAYFSNCPSDGVVGKDEQEAKINLLKLRGPNPDFIWEYNSFLASDECPWSVKTPYWPGVLGLGGCPHEAFQDWQDKFANTWHRKRLENLFTLIRGLAVKNVDFNFQTPKLRTQAQFELAEVTAFIEDWRAEKIGILRSR